ncbi:MAG: hypothetical protein NTW66_03220 [Candidatus Magasanikbacteria bacterium]|nr:hypothetical protein [Candidatus Magasanikbacteria bacterium]
MILKRKIKYQIEHYKRLLLGYCRCLSIPAWIYGYKARLAYAGVFASLLLAYICQVSVASGSGYEVNDLQKRVADLKSEIQKINVEVASLNALPNLEKRVQTSGMIAVASIKYVKPADIAVAKK